jgi:intracellular septation protein A
VLRAGTRAAMRARRARQDSVDALSSQEFPPPLSVRSESGSRTARLSAEPAREQGRLGDRGAMGPHRSAAREAARRTAVSITVGCVVPAVAFYAVYVAAGVWPAIGVALAWTYGAVAWRRVTGRPVSGLLVLSAGVLTLRTLVALAAGSPFLYFLQPVLSDFVLGAVFLGSLLSARPVVARLAPDFYPMDDEVAARPAIRRLFSWLTGMWGAACLTKAVVMLWLLTSQPMDTFVLVRSISIPSANGLTVVLTIGLAVLVARREGLVMGPRAAAPQLA